MIQFIQASADCIPLPDESVQCVVTSPPYWGLRDYGLEPRIFGGDSACEHDFIEEAVHGENRTGMGLAALGERYSGGGHKQGRLPDFTATRGICSKCGAWRGQLGLEPVPDCLGWATGKPCGQCFICHMLAVFREVRRVLRPDGTCFLNIGDSYAGSGKGPVGEGTKQKTSRAWADKANVIRGKRLQRGQGRWGGGNNAATGALKPKDLCLIPQRLALALQADGWYIRQEIIWHKPNAMPESVADRCTKSHEQIWLLAKSSRYYYDSTAIAEDASPNTHARISQATLDSQRGGAKQDAVKAGAAGVTTAQRSPVDILKSYAAKNGCGTRNARSVWTIPTQPVSEAHFATFPESLPERCIKAGTSEAGCCPACGTPWRRVTEKSKSRIKDAGKRKRAAVQRNIGATSAFATGEWTPPANTTGWEPACACAHVRARACPCVVLDPFSGSGTTAHVANQLGRLGIGLDLNQKYIEIAKRRALADVTPRTDEQATRQGLLFA